MPALLHHLWAIVYSWFMGKHSALATRIRELRRVLNWTQQDLSRASEVSRSYISRLEMGDIRLPSNDKLRSLATALGTTPDDLLCAAGFLDNSATGIELPEIELYLRRKYTIRDPRVLQAIETIVAMAQQLPDAEIAASTQHADMNIPRHDQSNIVHH